MIEAIGPEGFSIDPNVVNKAWLKEIGVYKKQAS